MSDGLEKLKKKILKDVARYAVALLKPGPFVKGASKVPYAGRVLDARDAQALVDASLDLWLTAGRFAEKFEGELGRYFGGRRAFLVNSGSSANLLAVSALISPMLGSDRLKPQDEVITTACGFPTTVAPMVQNGLVPVFVDVELGTYNICTRDLKKALSRRTRAIMIAHTLGNPADLDAVVAFARRHGLWLIEDNCDALGSRYRGRLTGTFGDISTLSFYPAHHMTMGEGGAVLTKDARLKRIILSLRDWGRDCWCPTGKDGTCGRRFGQKHGQLSFGYDHKYVYSHLGYNLKVTDMQAAIGSSQFAKLPAFIEKRRENFAFLLEGLRSYRDIFLLPQPTLRSDPSWFGFPLLVKPESGFTRDEIVQGLEGRGIATRMLFGGNLMRQPAMKGVRSRHAGDLANTDRVMNDLFWIGVYPGLTRIMQGYVLSAFRDILRRR
jgi:CDP-6-deoxy-D-xylo-4-hexulose-3-dehydrase